MTKEFILPFAGMIKFEKRTSAGTISTAPEDTYISSSDAVVKITRETTVESKTIESGNSYDPVRTRRTKYIQGLGVTLNSFDRQIYRMGTGATKTEVETNATTEIVEEHTVPTEGYKIVLPYTASSINNIKDATTGSAITVATEETVATVATGTYKFDETTNSVEFNEDMAGKTAIINYSVPSTSNSKDILSTTPTSGVYKVTMYYQTEDLKVGDTKTFVTAEYDSLEFKDGMKHPENSKDTPEWSFELSSVASQGNTKEIVTYTDETALTVFGS